MTDHPSVGARVSYDSGELLETDLAPTPLAQFERWYAAARAPAVAGLLSEPNAMVLSTVDPAGRPTSRTVLLKGVDGAGFRLFTNLGSRKARAMTARPDVSLLFGWHAVGRQVAVLGRAEPLSRDTVAEYFASRPWGSRVGAWVSEQSAVASSRAAIDERAVQLAARYPDTGAPGDVPVPEHWGGFLVRAREVEFWQGRPSRLHDRLVYLSRAAVDGQDGEQPAALDSAAAWRVERRWP